MQFLRNNCVDQVQRVPNDLRLYLPPLYIKNILIEKTTIWKRFKLNLARI